MKTRCDDCEQEWVEGKFTPWAFPLTDMRFDAGLRFCSEECLNAYEFEHGAVPLPGEESKP
jgi:hypothetical protein